MSNYYKFLVCFLFIFPSLTFASISSEYEKMISSCNESNSFRLHKSLEERVVTKFNQLSGVDKSTSFYGKGLESQLHGIFSVGVYDKEPKRLRPLLLCWMSLYDWERASKSEKNQHLTAWRSCMDRVYSPRSQVAHELYSCLSKVK